MADLTRRTAFVLLALVAGASGCDYFRPAVPEPPSAIIPPANYTSRERTLQTMSNGIAAKSVNPTSGSLLYLGGLDETFRQYWSQSDLDTWQGLVPSEWDRSRELQLYNCLIQLRPSDEYDLEWGPGDVTDDIDDVNGVATIHRHYQVVTNSEAGSSIIAIGYADLTFRRDSESRWLIVRWDDRRDLAADPEDPEQMTLGRRRLLSHSCGG